MKELIPEHPNVNNTIPKRGLEKTVVIHNKPKIILGIEKPIIDPMYKIIYSFIKLHIFV